MSVSIRDQLQSVSGDLLGARVALDAEWSEAMERYNYNELPNSKKWIEAAYMLASAQSDIDKARDAIARIKFDDSNRKENDRGTSNPKG